MLSSPFSVILFLPFLECVNKIPPHIDMWRIITLVPVPQHAGRCGVSPPQEATDFSPWRITGCVFLWNRTLEQEWELIF